MYIGLSENDFIEPVAFFIAGQDETFGTAMFITVTPEVLPVTGLLQIVLIKIFFSQPFGNRGNGCLLYTSDAADE